MGFDTRRINFNLTAVLVTTQAIWLRQEFPVQRNSIMGMSDIKQIYLVFNNIFSEGGRFHIFLVKRQV